MAKRDWHLRRALACAALGVVLALAGCASTAPHPSTPPAKAASEPRVVRQAEEIGGWRPPLLPADHSRDHLVRTPWLGRVPDPFRSGSAGVHSVECTPGGFRWGIPAPGPVAAWELDAFFRLPGDTIVMDSVAMWRVRSAPESLGEPALLRWAALLAADRDTARADSVLSAPGINRSIWAWDALQVRERLALARGDTLGADTLLAPVDTTDWTLAEQAAWTAERARLAAARGDTAVALGLARAAMRRFPSLPGASAGVRLADAIATARAESLSVPDARAAAEVEALRGSVASAATRLAGLRMRVDAADRGALLVRVAELSRRARRFDSARRAIAAADSVTREPVERSRVMLERARILRDAGLSDSALVVYARAVRTGPPSVREAALWERARELQDAGRWIDAAAAFDTVIARGTRRAEARFLSGLMSYAAGRTDRALARWEGDTLESARFWRGVELRHRGDARGDTLLRELAALPGYLFYRAAARDTLGVRGLPDSCEVGGGVSGVWATRADQLARGGLIDDALRLASRWLAHDPRLGASTDSVMHGDAIAAAHLAWVFGRTPSTVTFTLQAQRLAAELPIDQQWALVPWAYPPAFDSLVVTTADSLRLEPALLWATMRQESRFDPSARSTSNALGLMQLLLPAAQDAAKLGGEPKPTTEDPLLDPATNLKWGARYLNRLIERFDGHPAVALSAYNAGPSSLPPFWRELIERGGEALFCEVASNSDAQDYARRILGYRQAYRELRPSAGP